MNYRGNGKEKPHMRTIDQDKIDKYYEKKKTEVAAWIREYTNSLKRITDEQRATLMAYADHMSFKRAGECNAYVQNLPTVSKRDKNKLFQYLQKVDWLPPGETLGFLDGQLTVRMLPDPAGDMIRRTFGDSQDEKEKNDRKQNNQ